MHKGGVSMKVMTAADAVKLIKDNDTVTIGSLVGLLVPNMGLDKLNRDSSTRVLLKI
jgi:acyl CoA:acetate/3-ketoacid CoA transferase